jgi:hypothetical protein
MDEIGVWEVGLELKKARIKIKTRGQLDDLGVGEAKTGRMRECSPHILKCFLKIHFKIILPSTTTAPRKCETRQDSCHVL